MSLRHRLAHALYALRGGECAVILPEGGYIFTAPILAEGYIAVKTKPDPAALAPLEEWLT